MNDVPVPSANFPPLAINAEPALNSLSPLVPGKFGHVPATTTGTSPPLMSSWFQRWKPREERECLNINSSDKNVKSCPAEPLQRVYSQQPHELEALKASSPPITAGGAIESANEKQKESHLKDISRDTVQKTLKGQCKAAVTDSEEATPRRTHRVAAVPSSGFGPWINLSSKGRPEDEKGCEGDGQGNLLSADTQRINGKLTHQGSQVLSNSGIRPGINADFSGRTDNKSKVISGRPSSPTKVSPVSDTSMEPVACRLEAKNGAESVPEQSLTFQGVRSSPVGSFGALSVVAGPRSTGKPLRPPPRSGAPPSSKLGLPPRPNSKRVQYSSVFGVRSSPSFTTLPAGGKDALRMSHSVALAPTDNCSRIENLLTRNDVSMRCGTKVILDERFPISSINVTDPPVVPRVNMGNHVQIEKEVAQGSLTSTVMAFSAKQNSSKQYKIASERQLKRSSLMPPPASIPSARRQCQRASAEQDGFDASYDKKAGSAHAGRLENTEKYPTIIKMSGVLQPKLTGPLEVGRDGGSLGNCEGTMLQQSCPKPSFFTAYSELKGSDGIEQSDRAEEATPELAAGVSTAAIRPLETFVNAAGSSKKAGESFVEVYNKARDELKNQRSSLIRGNSPEKQTGDSPSLTYRQEVSPSRSMSRIVPGHQLGCLQSVKARGENDGESFGINVEVIDSKTGRAGEFADSQQLVSKSIARQGAMQCSHEDVCQKTGPSGVTCRPGHTSGFNIKSSAFAMYHGQHVEQISPSGKAQHPEKECHSQGQSLVTEDVKQKAIHCRIPQEQGKAQVYDDGNIGKGKNSTEGTLRSDKFSFSINLRKEIAKFLGSNLREDEAVFCLGERNRQTFEESVDINCCSGTTGKSSTEGLGKPVIRPHIWLQHWYPTAVRRKFMQGFTEPLCDSVTKISSGCSSCIPTTLEGTKLNLPNSKNVKENLIEKGNVVELIRTPSKLLASAAAMAIVGTTSRQFHHASPRRKGSVATWAAFGMPP